MLSSPAASGCNGLHFSNNTPIVKGSLRIGTGVEFIFTHDNTDGEYTCFVSDQETCPKTTQEQECDQLQTVNFPGPLQAGVLYRVGCTCRFQGIVRTITRSFSTPAQPFADCNAYLINDGISFFNYTADGDATTCFMWTSTGSPSGFRCSIDSGTPFTCECHLVRVCVYLCIHVSTPSVGESPLYRELSVAHDRHTIKISPQGCPGDATFLFRKFDVPMEGFATPFSID